MVILGSDLETRRFKSPGTYIRKFGNVVGQWRDIDRYQVCLKKDAC